MRNCAVMAEAGRVRSPNRWRAALCFLAPALALMVLFKLWPILAALLASVQRFNPAGRPLGFAGLSQYADILADPRFQHGLWLNLLATCIKLPLQVGLGLGAALMLRRPARGNALARAIVICPMFLGLPVSTFIFAYLFDLNVGLVNTVIGAIGLPRVGWLTQPLDAQITILALSLWRDMGLTMMVFLAGLNAIPQDIVSAARLDGASRFAILRTITLPMLARSMQFAVVLVTLASFQMLVPVLMLTRGGPSGATDLASFQIYEAAFSYFDLGHASAMSVVIFIALLALVAVQLRVLRVKWVNG